MNSPCALFRGPAAAVLLLVPLGACGGHGADAATGSDDPAQEIRDLVAALTPLEPTATTGAKDDWYPRRRKTLDRLRKAGPEVGREALEVWRRGQGMLIDVQRGLLDVAAHTAPEEIRPDLEDLVVTYGRDPALRAAACRLLAVAAPESARELLEPMLRSAERKSTYPPTEKILIGWLEAMKRLDADPVDVLTLVATDIRHDTATRVEAVEHLRGRPGEVVQQALEQILVESLGDELVRRKAAQSLRDTLPREEFCALIGRVLNREASANFQVFLVDMLEVNCG